METAFRYAKLLVMFYIANEGISIIENGVRVIPILKNERHSFYNRDKNENEDDINE